jgi:hypothetical protein
VVRWGIDGSQNLEHVLLFIQRTLIREARYFAMRMIREATELQCFLEVTAIIPH